jgi:uncharacterized SAM-binding protein YcdF (DUF218 family)
MEGRMNLRIIKELTDFVFVEDNIEKADIIFVPGGSHPELGEYAASLWKQGYAPLVMPSGGVSIKTGKFNGVKAKQEIYNKYYTTDCEFLSDVLIMNGVSKSAIIGENQSSFTKDNAYFSRKVLDGKGIIIEKAIICCKNFHARRALMCYQFAFPEVEFRVYPTPYYEQDIDITKDNWYQTEAGIKRVLGELQRYSNQFMEEFDLIKEQKL